MAYALDAAEQALLATELGFIRWWQDAAGLYFFEPCWWSYLGLKEPMSGVSVQQLQELMVQPHRLDGAQSITITWRHASAPAVSALWLAVEPQRGWLRVDPMPTRKRQLHLEALERMVGSDAMPDVLQDFANSLAKLQQQLADAVAVRDHRQLERCSHKLKSSCRLVGANETAALLEQVELACRQGSVEDLAERWRQLEPLLFALALEVQAQLSA